MNFKPYLRPLRRHRALSPLVVLRDRLRERILLSDHPWIRRSKWLVHDATQEGYCNPFFIIAHPRSGTTLLRAILAQHPAVFIPPENGKIGAMIRTFGTYRAQPWNIVVDAVLEVSSQGYEFGHWQIDLAALKRAAEALPEKQRTLARLFHLLYYTYGSIHFPGKTQWGDKTVTGNVTYLDKLELVFPEARYIHIVRDGRDCVSSAVKAGMFRKDYIFAANRWRNNVRKCRLFGKKLKKKKRYVELRYEDLVSIPALVVSSVCDFLALEPTEAMLDYQGKVEHMSDVLTISHHQNVARPIFQDSIGNWKQQLSPSTLRAVMKIIEPELTVWGYR
jgi:protein-tyrosine sulfotransferase